MKVWTPRAGAGAGAWMERSLCRIGAGEWGCREEGAVWWWHQDSELPWPGSLGCHQQKYVYQNSPEHLQNFSAKLLYPYPIETSPQNVSGVFQRSLAWTPMTAPELVPLCPMPQCQNGFAGSLALTQPVALGSCVLPTALQAQQLPDLGSNCAAHWSRRGCWCSEYCGPCPTTAPFPVYLHVVSLSPTVLPGRAGLWSWIWLKGHSGYMATLPLTCQVGVKSAPRKHCGLGFQKE